MNKAVLFVIFNRYDKSKLVFEQIRKVKPPRLYVVADGPRENNKDDIINCQKNREIIKERRRFKNTNSYDPECRWGQP